MSTRIVTPGWVQAERESELTIELAPGVPMFFRRIPAGSFWMGARGWYRQGDWFAHEEPRHRVVLSRECWMGTFPVTQEQFDVWTRDEGTEHANGFPGEALRPAENLDWQQARQFCAWLTRGELLPAGWRAELPTEARWEQACRAGTESEYHTGDGEAALAEAGWYSANSGRRTHPVGSKRPNEFGLFDMHGNVWEWCLDAWDKGAYRERCDGVRDPLVGRLDDSVAVRVIRGGSWVVDAGNCRSAFRDWWRPSIRFGNQGFRVALLPGPVASRQTDSQQAAKARAGGGEGGVEPTDQAPERAGASATSHHAATRDRTSTPESRDQR